VGEGDFSRFSPAAAFSGRGFYWHLAGALLKWAAMVGKHRISRWLLITQVLVGFALISWCRCGMHIVKLKAGIVGLPSTHGYIERSNGGSNGRVSVCRRGQKYFYNIISPAVFMQKKHFF
jgi:hypothetical protein